MVNKVLEINSLSFTYPGENKPALNDLNIKINDGEFVVVYGKSGCSKTTLLRHLKPEMTPHGESHGEIFINGENIKSLTGVRSAKRSRMFRRQHIIRLRRIPCIKSLLFRLSASV